MTHVGETGSGEGAASHRGSPAFWLLLGWFAATAVWWGIALAALPVDAPEWVVRARYICFGTPRSGLPDISGWLLLIASPLSFLVALLAIWGAELRSDLWSRWRGRRSRWSLILLSAVLLAGTAWVADRIETASSQSVSLSSLDTGEPFPEHYPRLNREANPFVLVDRHGETVSMDDLRGQLVFLTFAFAHCNAICPLTVQQVLRGARESPAPYRVVVITLDPWRDTARSLAAISSQWGLDGETGIALSGEVETVNAVLDAYGVMRNRDASTGDITHPGLVYVIDRDGRIAYALNQPPSAWVTEAGTRADVSAMETASKQPAQ